MRLLLDTHTFLWFVEDDPKLSATAKTVIEDPANDILVSPATYWEITIKVSIGKYVLARPFLPFIEDQIAINRFGILPITPAHTAGLIGLPFHHKDPFDRLLVAQAIAENIPLVTCDKHLLLYPIARVW